MKRKPILIAALLLSGYFFASTYGHPAHGMEAITATNTSTDVTIELGCKRAMENAKYKATLKNYSSSLVEEGGCKCKELYGDAESQKCTATVFLKAKAEESKIDGLTRKEFVVDALKVDALKEVVPKASSILKIFLKLKRQVRLEAVIDGTKVANINLRYEKMRARVEKANELLEQTRAGAEKDLDFDLDAITRELNADIADLGPTVRSLENDYRAYIRQAEKRRAGNGGQEKTEPKTFSSSDLSALRGAGTAQGFPVPGLPQAPDQGGGATSATDPFGGTAGNPLDGAPGGSPMDGLEPGARDAKEREAERARRQQALGQFRAREEIRRAEADAAAQAAAAAPPAVGAEAQQTLGDNTRGLANPNPPAGTGSGVVRPPARVTTATPLQPTVIPKNRPGQTKPVTSTPTKPVASASSKPAPGRCASFAGSGFRGGAWDARWTLKADCTGTWCEQTLTDSRKDLFVYGWHCHRASTIAAGFGEKKVVDARLEGSWIILLLENGIYIRVVRR